MKRPAPDQLAPTGFRDCGGCAHESRSMLPVGAAVCALTPIPDPTIPYSTVQTPSITARMCTFHPRVVRLVPVHARPLPPPPRSASEISIFSSHANEGSLGQPGYLPGAIRYCTRWAGPRFRLPGQLHANVMRPCLNHHSAPSAERDDQENLSSAKDTWFRMGYDLSTRSRRQ